ncbi:hypothetical protein [Nocardia sp. NPDC019395]|uniref:hypothetical protein n=1 Tax=Nocardia sp. NPDC019395 TaxID=3154686 RepID=UPI003409A830
MIAPPTVNSLFRHITGRLTGFVEVILGSDRLSAAHLPLSSRVALSVACCPGGVGGCCPLVADGSGGEVRGGMVHPAGRDPGGQVQAGKCAGTTVE